MVVAMEGFLEGDNVGPREVGGLEWRGVEVGVVVGREDLGVREGFEEGRAVGTHVGLTVAEVALPPYLVGDLDGAIGGFVGIKEGREDGGAVGPRVERLGTAVVGKRVGLGVVGQVFKSMKLKFPRGPEELLLRE